MAGTPASPGTRTTWASDLVDVLVIRVEFLVSPPNAPGLQDQARG